MGDLVKYEVEQHVTGEITMEAEPFTIQKMEDFVLQARAAGAGDDAKVHINERRVLSSQRDSYGDRMVIYAKALSVQVPAELTHLAPPREKKPVPVAKRPVMLSAYAALIPVAFVVLLVLCGLLERGITWAWNWVF